MIVMKYKFYKTQMRRIMDKNGRTEARNSTRMLADLVAKLMTDATVLDERVARKSYKYRRRHNYVLEEGS